MTFVFIWFLLFTYQTTRSRLEITNDPHSILKTQYSPSLNCLKVQMVQKASNSKESLSDSVHQEGQGNHTFNKRVACENAVSEFITVPSTELSAIMELLFVCVTQL